MLLILNGIYWVAQTVSNMTLVNGWRYRTAGATPLTNFILNGFTASTNNLTGTTTDSRAVAKNPGDTTNSTLALKTVEMGYDATWSDQAIGLGPYDNPGAGSIENAFYIYIPNDRQLIGNAGAGEFSLGFTLPASTTSKVRCRVVVDTVFWRVFFEYSTNSGGSWTILNSGGTLTTATIATPLYAVFASFVVSVVLKDIKGDI